MHDVILHIIQVSYSCAFCAHKIFSQNYFPDYFLIEISSFRLVLLLPYSPAAAALAPAADDDDGAPLPLPLLLVAATTISPPSSLLSATSTTATITSGGDLNSGGQRDE